MQLTAEQIASLAPDAASLKAAQGISNSSQWPALGAHEDVVWGECRGSGKNPYQVRVDLSEPAFKCSCPSRKFPCKHALGLMLLYTRDGASFQAGAPQWVEEWLASRQARAEKKQARAEQKAQAPADPEAKARREDKRREQIRRGLEDLNTWLTDLVRIGFSDLPLRPHGFWTGPAARLVDAQAPGLAAGVESMRDIVARRATGWPEDLLAAMGRLKLAIEAFARYDTLGPELQADLRAVLGWALDKDEVLSDGEAFADAWRVLGISGAENLHLRERRTWLQGAESGRAALLLDFAYGNQPLPAPLLPGTVFQGTLAFYPAAWPLRALLKDTPRTLSHASPVDAAPAALPALEGYARAIARNPWLLRYPMSIRALRPWRREGRLYLRDAEGRDVPLSEGFRGGWELLALSGGHPLTVFGEWRDNALLLLAAWGESYHHFGYQG